MSKCLCLLIVAGVVVLCLFCDEVAQGLGIPPTAARWILGITALMFVAGIPLLTPEPFLTRLEQEGNRPATPAAEYNRLGWGAVPPSSDAHRCYLDLLERALTNVLYEDMTLMVYDSSRRSRLAEGFDLERRTCGEDVPWQAHTMAGLKRLENVRQCVETVIVDQVPGDLVELGVLRGGCSIFMRGVLRAFDQTDRKVYACDTFVPRAKLSPFTRQFLLPLVSVFASIPFRPFQRWLCSEYIRKSGSFPAVNDPSDELIDMTLFTLQHVSLLSHHRGTGLDDVKSNFARYGLLDEQVVFLKGYFSDTLSDAPIEKLALLRLDGDTFESTRDSLALLYDKLSPGGFCIIDDYYAFVDCQNAIDRFREKHGITDQIIRIDNMSVYWRKRIVI